MENRKSLLISLRPKLKKSNILANSTEIEAFQNTTIRPIIKFQHNLFIRILKNRLDSLKFNITSATETKISEKITSVLNTNDQLRQQLIHSITGLYTIDEFEFYIKNSKEIHKRIIQICKERFLTNIEELS